MKSQYSYDHECPICHEYHHNRKSKRCDEEAKRLWPMFRAIMLMRTRGKKFYIPPREKEVKR
jgi:hypothetical protein